MILGKDTNPQKQLYYLGAQVLAELNQSDQQEFDYLDIYHSLKKREGISINLFSMVLDWLFILGAIKNKNGRLIKCF